MTGADLATCKSAPAGAVTVITRVAVVALKLASAALVAVTVQLPVAVPVTVLPDRLQEAAPAVSA